MKSTASTNHGSSRWTEPLQRVLGQRRRTRRPGRSRTDGPRRSSSAQISPSQNTGIEIPISASDRDQRGPTTVPRVTAEITPTRIPKKSQMIPAPIAERERRRNPLLDLRRRRSSWLVYDTRLAVEQLLHHSPSTARRTARRSPSFARMSAMFCVGRRPAGDALRRVAARDLR